MSDLSENCGFQLFAAIACRLNLPHDVGGEFYCECYQRLMIARNIVAIKLPLLREFCLCVVPVIERNDADIETNVLQFSACVILNSQPTILHKIY